MQHGREINLFTQRPGIEDQFQAFDAEHPEVFELFRDLAQKVRAAGFARYSADALLHRIRWHFSIEKGDREWTINNNYSSRYARKLMSADPSFVGFFETRQLKAS